MSILCSNLYPLNINPYHLAIHVKKKNLFRYITCRFYLAFLISTCLVSVQLPFFDYALWIIQLSLSDLKYIVHFVSIFLKTFVFITCSNHAITFYRTAYLLPQLTASFERKVSSIDCAIRKPILS